MLGMRRTPFCSEFGNLIIQLKTFSGMTLILPESLVAIEPKMAKP